MLESTNEHSQSRVTVLTVLNGGRATAAHEGPSELPARRRRSAETPLAHGPLPILGPNSHSRSTNSSRPNHRK